MGGLFGGAEAPTVAEPVVMPTEDTAAVAAAKKKKAAEVQSRSGRQSTILTEQTDKLGG